MAGLYDTSATKALNEDAYINKLYDGTLESQKKALQQGTMVIHKRRGRPRKER